MAITGLPMPLDLSRLHNQDAALLVELVGTKTLVELCAQFQQFPGCGLERLSETALNNLLQALKVIRTDEKLASGSTLEHVSKFQSKCNMLLSKLAFFLAFDEAIETSQTTGNTKQETRELCCSRCLQGKVEGPLISCDLDCGAYFHESCKAKVIQNQKNNSLKCCKSCFALALFSLLAPSVLASESKALAQRLEPFLLSNFDTSMLHIKFAPFALPATQNYALNIVPSLNNGLPCGKQLNQLQMYTHQVGGVLPCWNTTNGDFAVGLQQQVASTQNVFQLWGSLEQGKQAAAAQNKRVATVTESVALPAKRKKTVNGRSDETQEVGKDEKKSGWNGKQGGKQRRTRWLSNELETLWKGILIHGNRWYEVKNKLPGRTYYQVKDKGRRLLYTHGWKTGRLKNDNNGAYEDAKEIARIMLSGNKKLKEQCDEQAAQA